MNLVVSYDDLNLFSRLLSSSSSSSLLATWLGVSLMSYRRFVTEFTTVSVKCYLLLKFSCRYFERL